MSDRGQLPVKESQIPFRKPGGGLHIVLVASTLLQFYIEEGFHSVAVKRLRPVFEVGPYF